MAVPAGRAPALGHLVGADGVLASVAPGHPDGDAAEVRDVGAAVVGAVARGDGVEGVGASVAPKFATVMELAVAKKRAGGCTDDVAVEVRALKTKTPAAASA